MRALDAGRAVGLSGNVTFGNAAAPLRVRIIDPEVAAHGMNYFWRRQPPQPTTQEHDERPCSLANTPEALLQKLCSACRP